ncbi:hypothetical protein BGZ82_005214 [Podila clonocystis]|nr:hypothetical protein BGZ82_005214 [Podila clonocystis]
MEYTCQKVSRIDMIFLSTSLTNRLVNVSHKDMSKYAIGSDHRLVRAQLSLHSLITPIKSPKFNKPTGHRFCFKEAEDEHWDSLSIKANMALNNTTKLEQLGLQPFKEDDPHISLGTLQVLDIEQVWRWYSKTLFGIAKQEIPGKIVGKTGNKPQDEVSLLYISSALQKCAKRAAGIRKQPKNDR